MFRNTCFVLMTMFLAAENAHSEIVKEMINFINNDGITGLNYNTTRTHHGSYSIWLSKEVENLGTYYYIYPNNYKFDTDDDKYNFIRFSDGDYGTIEDFDLSESTRFNISEDGIYTYKTWDGVTKNSEGHYGVWNTPDDIDSLAYVWVLPTNFEYVDYKSNRDGEWVLRNNTLSFFASNTNDVVFEIRYRPRQQAIFKELKDQLTSEPDIELEQESDSIKLTLLGTILFDSGDARLSERGRGVLSKVAETLEEQQHLKILIEGHTDNVPIQGHLAEMFPTNWELSAARSLAVVHHMALLGLSESRLEARAFGEHRPEHTNETEEGRAKNRRIEVRIIDEELYDEAEREIK